MKATGIIRRIDDLGRVVIPKEIRRTCKIKEGDPMEIFVDREGAIIFKKYSPTADYDAEYRAIVRTLERHNIKGALYDNCEMLVSASDRSAPNECPFEGYNSNHYPIRIEGDMWGHFVANRALDDEEDKLVKFAIDMFIKIAEN